MLVAEVADHDHESRLARHPPYARQRVGQAVGMVLAVGRDALGERPPQRDDPGLGASRREHSRRGGAERDEADAARPPHAEATEHERDALGHVRLQAARGPERHRGGDVEHDPGGERALGHVQADVSLPRAGGRRGVDMAHVVADLVRTKLSELHPDAHAGSAPIARQHPRHQPRDREVERLDQRLGQRAGALARRRRLEQRRGHRARTTVGASRIRSATPGSGTAVSTRSSNWSAVTPSARAS